MNKPLLILPVENQVRELDAKLLLACIAVEYGYRSIIGFKSRIDSRLGRFAPGIYFAKSLTNRNVKVFRTLRKLGHSIVAWDEESLVHYPPEIYYARRLGMDGEPDPSRGVSGFPQPGQDPGFGQSACRSAAA
jgi:surface carbohydrate biosynthesis protein